jgi:small subunit ribosomal protein S4
MRLDNLVYRMNFAYSRRHAREMIKHGFFAVNGHRVSIPSYQARINDEIAFREKGKTSDVIKAMLEDVKGLVEVPGWLVVDVADMKGKINALPTREDISLKDVEERLIVELYSK